MFAKGDGWVFAVYATSLALMCVVLSQGRLAWWTDSHWIGLCLIASIVLFGLYVAVELRREKPLLDLHWITSPFMLRFIFATLLFRVVLSEQTVGAVGLMNTLGFYNDQMHGQSTDVEEFVAKEIGHDRARTTYEVGRTRRARPPSNKSLLTESPSTGPHLKTQTRDEHRWTMRPRSGCEEPSHGGHQRGSRVRRTRAAPTQ